MKKDMYSQYTRLHDHTWDEVLMRMYEANMRNFVVYLHGGLLSCPRPRRWARCVSTAVIGGAWTMM